MLTTIYSVADNENARKGFQEKLQTHEKTFATPMV